MTTAPVSTGLGERAAKQALWDAFCETHDIAKASVPLFAADAEGRVEVFGYGRDRRPMLRRSPLMEALLADTVERVLHGTSMKIEGVLSLMLRLDEAGRVVPLYVGKAGRYGRTGEVSANLNSIRANAGKFARWASGPPAQIRCQSLYEPHWPISLKIGSGLLRPRRAPVVALVLP